MATIKDQFLLNDEITFLNHGSFGACPKPIFEAYQAYQVMLEKEPIQFITKTGVKLLAESKTALANYLNCDADDLIYMTNPSFGINTIVKSLNLKEGDEILTTDQEYGATDRTWKYYCNKVGAKYVQQKINLPLVSIEKFLADFWSGLTANTKIIFLSQITSPTALIFPVQEICARAKELGLLVIIDGAHAPAHIELDLKKLNPDVYLGACHKWMLAPKGSSFLYVKKSFQTNIDPLVISWGYESDFPSHSQFQDYHQFQGTRDFSAFLTTPACLKFLEENHWSDQTKKSRAMVQQYYPILAKELNSHLICPLEDTFLGQMCSVPISTTNPLGLKAALYDEYKIEIPVVTFTKQIYLRMSLQPYNSEKDVEILIDALREIKRKTNLIG